MDKFFKITESNSTVKTEIIAGLTTFVTMSYIIFVNPNIIGGESIRVTNGVIFATCLSSCIGSLLMALLGKLPFAQAPGMGLNAFFAFTVMPAMVSLASSNSLAYVEQYQMALGIVFLSGIFFIAITVFGLREMVIRAIPKNIKIAISSGIGLFLIFLGLQNSKIVIGSSSTLVTINNLNNLSDANTRGAIIAIIGLCITTVLHKKKVKASILIGIVITTIICYLPVIGVTSIPADLDFDMASKFKDFTEVSLFGFIPGLELIFNGKNLLGVITVVAILIISFSLVDMLDTIGSILGTAKEANLLDKDGNMPKMRQALLCDAIATTTGAMLGSSTVTTYVESGTGIKSGGKTGLVALVVSILFLASCLLSPIITLVPSVATAPALIFVGSLILYNIKELDFSDLTETIPGFITVTLIPLTYSIANGIALGIISYVLIKLFSLKFKELHVSTVILAIIFVIRYLILVS